MSLHHPPPFRASRRSLLQIALAAVSLASVGRPVRAADEVARGPALGPPEPFDLTGLREMAEALAAEPHRELPVDHAELLASIDYDVHQQIQFRPERALWAGDPTRLPVRFFHLHRYVQQPVRLHVVEGDAARPILYQKDDFTYGSRALAERMPDDLGFAGFRVMDGQEVETDWLAYQGASYFRTSGALGQYGLSARGLAIDTGLPTPEEFPRFSQFWLEQGPGGEDRIRVYALLESRSVTGAYRFDWRHQEGAVADVDVQLFCRHEIARMGMAPLTSMFWFGELRGSRGADWRPEIHDSDGLALWTGAGERIWRPLNNPHRVQTSSFFDRDPKGFGLLQRDRVFDHFLDDGVFYDRRPSVWVEPQGGWGEGAVQLVEIPTDDEIHDNVVAYWLPAEPARAGSSWSFRYRLHWLADEPYPPQVARVRHTRSGRGGIPGQPRPAGLRKLVVDFAGGPLDRLTKGAPVEPVITASRGRIANATAFQIVGTRAWRVWFDIEAEGDEPVDLRCHLRLDDRPLSETWLHQHWPEAD